MTARELGNQSAYPRDQVSCGLTKREAMAMAAMVGMLSGDKQIYRSIQETAVSHADALLAELAKEQKQ